MSITTKNKEKSQIVTEVIFEEETLKLLDEPQIEDRPIWKKGSTCLLTLQYKMNIKKNTEGQFYLKVNYLCLSNRYALFELELNINVLNPLRNFFEIA